MCGASIIIGFKNTSKMHNKYRKSGMYHHNLLFACVLLISVVGPC